MYCGTCHKDSPNDFKKCPNCGRPTKKERSVLILEDILRRFAVLILIGLFSAGLAYTLHGVVYGNFFQAELGMIMFVIPVSIFIFLRKTGRSLGSLCGR